MTPRRRMALLLAAGLIVLGVLVALNVVLSARADRAAEARARAADRLVEAANRGVLVEDLGPRPYGDDFRVLGCTLVLVVFGLALWAIVDAVLSFLAIRRLAIRRGRTGYRWLLLAVLTTPVFPYFLLQILADCADEARKEAHRADLRRRIAARPDAPAVGEAQPPEPGASVGDEATVA